MIGHLAQRHLADLLFISICLLPSACSPGTTYSLCSTHQAPSWTSTSGRRFGSRLLASAGWSSPGTSQPTKPARQQLQSSKRLCFLRKNRFAMTNRGSRGIILCPAVSMRRRQCTAAQPVWCCLGTGPTSSVQGMDGTARGKDIRLDSRSNQSNAIQPQPTGS